MRMLFALLTSFFIVSLTHADSQAFTKNAEFGLNRASLDSMPKYQLGSLVVSQKKWVLKGVYDFARDGGAVSTISLKDSSHNSLMLPKGAIVSNCLLDFRTATTSGGAATISFGTGQAANDLKSALAVASGTGLVACIPVGSAATSIKMTADRVPSISIATAALTAGKVSVLIEYFLSDSP